MPLRILVCAMSQIATLLFQTPLMPMQLHVATVTQGLDVALIVVFPIPVHVVSV
jgi:hypothetical protein